MQRPSPSALRSDQIVSQVPPLPLCPPAPLLPCSEPAMLAQRSTLPFVLSCTTHTFQVRISGQNALWLQRNNACKQRHQRCPATRPAPSRRCSGYDRHTQRLSNCIQARGRHQWTRQKAPRRWESQGLELARVAVVSTEHDIAPQNYYRSKSLNHHYNGENIFCRHAHPWGIQSI
jgi:hypothetical protein